MNGPRRLPAALAGLVCVALVYSFPRREGRPTAALIAALTLATANHFTGIARTARIDVPLAGAVTLRHACVLPRLYFRFAPSLASPRGGRGCPRRAAQGARRAGDHGPAAVVWLIVERPAIPRASWFLIPFVVVLLALPWFLWANVATNGEFFRVFFWHHTIERYTGSSALLASHPWWYYLPRFAIDFLPWTPWLIGLAVWATRSAQWRSDPLLRFASISFAVMVGVMSTAHFKRADYLLPAYPFAALALGCAGRSLAAFPDQQEYHSRGEVSVRRHARRRCARMGGDDDRYRAGGAGARKRSAGLPRPCAPAPRRRNTILQFRMESHLLSYHLGRPVHTLVEWGELNERLAVPGPHFVVMPPEYVFAASRIVTSRQLVEITRLEDYTAARPPRPLVFLRTAD